MVDLKPIVSITWNGNYPKGATKGRHCQTGLKKKKKQDTARKVPIRNSH